MMSDEMNPKAMAETLKALLCEDDFIDLQRMLDEDGERLYVEVSAIAVRLRPELFASPDQAEVQTKKTK